MFGGVRDSILHVITANGYGVENGISKVSSNSDSDSLRSLYTNEPVKDMSPVFSFARNSTAVRDSKSFS